MPAIGRRCAIILEAVFLDFDAIAAGLEIGDQKVPVAVGGVRESFAFVLICDFDFGAGDDASRIVFTIPRIAPWSIERGLKLWRRWSKQQIAKKTHV